MEEQRSAPGKEGRGPGSQRRAPGAGRLQELLSRPVRVGVMGVRWEDTFRSSSQARELRAPFVFIITTMQAVPVAKRGVSKSRLHLPPTGQSPQGLFAQEGELPHAHMCPEDPLRVTERVCRASGHASCVP